VHDDFGPWAMALTVVAVTAASACTRSDAGSAASTTMLPEIGNVRLGMSGHELRSARPAATSDSYSLEEDLESGAIATYLFQSDLPESVNITDSGLVAILVEYIVSESDSATWGRTLKRLESHWSKFGEVRIDVERPVQKYTTGPPIRTRLLSWELADAKVFLYSELEVPLETTRRERMIRVIIQDRELGAGALLPEEYHNSLSP
jgi:hypothetical protein